MEREPVSSSNILSIGYDHGTEILEVEFTNGSVYQYKNVSLVVYEELMQASSLGSYLNREISRTYPYERVG